MAATMTGARVITFPAREAHVAVRSVPRGGLRLTRRGRLVLRLGGVLLLALCVSVLVLVLSGTADAMPERAAIRPATLRVVLPGETLWGIATDVAPRQDPRETISTILELSGLTSPQVRAGQRLWVPSGS